MYAGKDARIENFHERRALFDHHYRHSIIHAWGAGELKWKLYPDEGFLDADDEWFAQLLSCDLEEYIPTLPSSSAMY